MEIDGKNAFNCGDTARGLDLLEDWLGDKNWRMIHFNFGLHDLKYLDEKGTYVSPEKGKQVAPLLIYEKNLRELVSRLKKTGAQLIFANTTPVPTGTVGRVAGDEKTYNEVAQRVMKENEVAITDLVGALGEKIGEYQLPKNVHFNEAGSSVLADAVSLNIQTALQKPWNPPTLERSYPKSFELAEPFSTQATKADKYLNQGIKLTRAIYFKPGQTITAQVSIESESTPSTLSFQIISRNGKTSSLSPKVPVTKNMNVTLSLPESPSLHPTSKNKEAWNTEDLITRINVVWRFEEPATGTMKVEKFSLITP
jgi:lysophospholipase L1-like esterase